MTNAQGQEGLFNPTSPHSSNGVADSFRGTPDTRLTAFSPEDGSTKSLRAPHSIGAAFRDSRPVRFSFGAPHSLNLPREPRESLDVNIDRDPFVSSISSSLGPSHKLSPTASCFAPSAIPNARIDIPEHTSIRIEEQVKNESKSAESAPLIKVSSAFAHDALSTDRGLSRCVVVATTTGDHVQVHDIEQYILILSCHNLQLRTHKQLQTRGNKVYVRFNNIRDACLFSQSAHLSEWDWIINYVHPREFSQAVDPTSGLITAHEGQLTLAVFAPPSLQNIEQNQLIEFMQGLLVGHGDLFAIKIHSEGVEGSVLSAIVEYCDNDTSLRAVAALHGTVAEGFQICMALHRPDIPSMTTLSHGRLISPTRAPANSIDLASDLQRLALTSRAPSTVTSVATGFLSTPTRSAASGYHVQPSYGMMPVVYHGMPMSPPYMLDPVSPRTPGLFSAGNYSWVRPIYPQQPTIMRPEFTTPRQYVHSQNDGRRQNAVRVHRSPYNNHSVGGQHNHVDVDRIREGIDVRTTIMLRNIPNKVDQAMLKRIIDESSWGKYDFMYLRIDFANDCNVGYAFINFVDPLDIIDFVNKRGNQRWNCFKSDKVAEISYATIQGKDCLVQKFRNSSVMLEAQHYRPKLYYTVNGPKPELAGQEEQFPEPDNQSKMKRSCENAEHVGLFTPNAGQHYRDEQRRRRSQFDRGTRLAAMEEYDFLPFHPQVPFSP